MERAEALQDLVAAGAATDPARCVELAAEYGMLVSDLLVVAGHPVPEHLRPPPRDREALREFAYRVTFCDHAQLALLETIVLSLPNVNPYFTRPTESQSAEADAAKPGADRFAHILDGLMRNRGFGLRELPFTGLSQSTIKGMLAHGEGSPSQLMQLKAMSAVLGWTFADLRAVAGESLAPFHDCSALCHHAGRVYMAAIRLTTEQLVQAADEADRLTGRVDHGAWRPGSSRLRDECPG